MVLTMLPVSTVSQTRSGYLAKSEKDLDAIKKADSPRGELAGGTTWEYRHHSSGANIVIHPRTEL